MMLSVENLNVHYGVIHAIRDISFEVNQGEIITLIGANGAGKTTTLQAVSAIVKKSGGKIVFEDEDITTLPPEQIVKKGLIQVPEGRRVFANMSVKENLELGAFTRKDKAKISSDFEMVFDLFPRLKERIRQMAGTLSGGEQQMLAMGRALMSSPRLLLLDEPSMGLAPILVDEIFSIIEKINSAGTTVLCVEQNAFKALSIANRAYIFETGKITKTGRGADLLKDDAVRAAYLAG